MPRHRKMRKCALCEFRQIALVYFLVMHMNIVMISGGKNMGKYLIEYVRVTLWAVGYLATMKFDIEIKCHAKFCILACKDPIIHFERRWRRPLGAPVTETLYFEEVPS